MNVKEILDYGNTLERTDEQSKRLDNASKVQGESGETVNYNYNGKRSKQHRKFLTSGGSSYRNSRPSSMMITIHVIREIKITKKRPQITTEGPKPVATVGGNSRTKMVSSLAQLEVNSVIVAKREVILQNIADLKPSTRKMRMFEALTKTKLMTIVTTRMINSFLLSTQVRANTQKHKSRLDVPK